MDLNLVTYIFVVKAIITLNYPKILTKVDMSVVTTQLSVKFHSEFRL